MDFELFKDILSIDSTSGKERELALFLEKRLRTPKNSVKSFEVGDGTLNLLFSWGEPQFYFCTHLDTVPPYIAPTFENDVIRGRGSCDAKGQIFSMFSACRELEREGFTDFALLLLAGEEIGSYGAKAYSRDCVGGKYVIVGEPTRNRMISASKGTKSFKVTIHGKSCHSGYPEEGESAVEKFVDFIDRIRMVDFPDDTELGKTVWNIGKLVSDNPQNVLSPEVVFRIYFRTTFASDVMVTSVMRSMAGKDIEIEEFGGDAPMRYFVLDGFETSIAAFGSDAPQLYKFENRILCGPGSILTAHRPDEYITLSELEMAQENYIKIYKTIKTCF